MAYDQSHYQPPRRNYQQQYPQDKHQEYAPHPQMNQRPPPPPQQRLNHFTSQPQDINGNYHHHNHEEDGSGRRAQTQRRPVASPALRSNGDNPFPTFPHAHRRPDPVPPGSVPIDDAMLSMNLQDDPPQNRPDGMARSHSDHANRAPHGGPHQNGGMGGGGPRGPPQLPGQRGPPQYQRMPPPRNNMQPGPPDDRGFQQQQQQQPRRPPPRQNTGNYDDGWAKPYNQETFGRDPHQQGPERGYGPPQRSMTVNPNLEGSERGFAPQRSMTGHERGFGPPQRSMTANPHTGGQNMGGRPPPPHGFTPQRSMTMPVNVDHQPSQHYTAYNPARHGTPAQNYLSSHRSEPSQEEVYRAGSDQGSRRAPDPNWTTENDVLDAYYGDSNDDQEYQYNNNGHYQTGAGGIVGYQGNYQEPDSYGNNHPENSSFAQQAHRSRSQPNLRGQARGPPPGNNGYSAGHSRHGGSYDGAVEMPADVPPIMTANGFPPPPPIPSIPGSLRVGSPALSQHSRSQAQNQPQYNMYPQTIGHNNSVSADSLPQHPPPPSSVRSQARYTKPDGLPEHPPPIRPGLIQDQGPGLPNHPPPRRQYSPDAASVTSQQSAKPQHVTQAELDQLQHMARVKPSDQKAQLTLAKKMVEAATVLASEGGKADVKTTRKNRENYIFDAHKIIKKLTNSSHPYPEAMFYLATCHGSGSLGLEIDHEKAFNLYQSAAKLNHGPSAYRTAVCCEIGAGVRKDPMKSMTWYKKAASLGDTAAMYKLGMILLKGLLGQPRTPREGIVWLKRASDQADEDNPHSLHELGLLYERADNNEIVIPDPNYARELFTKAAELNYSPSQFRLGCAHEYGQLGCPIDPRKSITWYSRAAMKGEPESELALSGWYLTGAEGVIQQSDTEAYLWARKAAERGLSKAEYALGYFTEVGIGVAANLDDAKRWYYQAASQQHPKAQLRLQELKKGGAAVQKSRERLSRSNKNKEDCVIM